MPPQYKIHILIHKDQELDQGAEVDFTPIRCDERSHPGYEEARQLDDERCSWCERRPQLVGLKGGRA